ncbi:DNA-binding transcriptional LysR family regulator [Saccharopolyspora erythraea NRRL 2338]|uniref:LysR-family transcriptional regulator n=2 Tax=Saccharopolyspora erythraea TaxID=1836 RepID=A4FG71_SACEN|nr:LysR family transcriptional regulator [Saccharopolyspora erythraea]EQD82323.1 LysR family transcriptional regulator [Saccharopolyspora erythraea D]PFG96751.1 DNA-binding transcriptional LysR family regulator [Saccharopolyspora erythraea NRRL 2338]QRK87001.1 LysR family transcriptional regulator [Saccharopolyspora erythraea]CAM03046.1 LysR-family transcriptional regulator [Saccharopolyspora erythraea NRRL 2338]
MTPPDPESLRLLVLVADLGSIGAAAVELRVSQPSASKRLSSLERGLGLELVERSRQGCTLTPAGVIVADWARQVLAQVDGLMNGVRALRAQHEPRLRVSASMTVAEYLAPAWISRLRRALPETHLELDVTNSQAVAEAVRHGHADLGFIETPLAPEGVSIRHVARDRMVVVVPPEHPWARLRRPLTPAELAATPLIVREEGSGTRETLYRALAEVGADPVAPLLELHSTTAVRNSVVAGAGPAVLSTLAVGTDLAEQRVTEVGVTGLDLRRPLHAVWRSGLRLTGPAAALLAIAMRTPD